jgi:hypothetical protein
MLLFHNQEVSDKNVRLEFGKPKIFHGVTQSLQTNAMIVT